MQAISSFERRSRAQGHRLVAAVAAIGILALAHEMPVHAAQVDIHGPPGYSRFGTLVTVLPNGNFVVTSRSMGSGGDETGAVHLYGADGTLISTLSGSRAYDRVGSSVVVVGDSNFVVISPGWKDSTGTSVGAVTWVNGITGLSGVVSASNSLFGTHMDDRIGSDGVTVLSNGNYVVNSSRWTNGVAPLAGAVTWGDGNRGISGRVTPSNSLVGTAYGDRVGIGGVTALSNGHYVVASPHWTNGVTNGEFGAVTWGNGNTGVRGAVSAGNSLVGTTPSDGVGGPRNVYRPGVTALSNGNYVVASPRWSNGETRSVGAVTWGNGSTGIRGPVTVGNSLIGTTLADEVGGDGVTALSNGNYVVVSPDWNNGVWGRRVGAVTWGNGRTGSVGVVSVNNSLFGATGGVAVGSGGITALSNGHYVVASPKWNDGTYGEFGAATWGNGDSGSSGPVSASNSLVGASPGDRVGVERADGRTGITALSNGNYVVASPHWSNVGILGVGATTWGNGGSGVRGLVSASNSLIGTTADDNVGSGGVTALTNGHYVVASPYWNNGTPNSKFGAATWANGSTAVAGYVSPENSLVGTTINDSVGGSVAALGNGNYVVASWAWSDDAGNGVGAVTWAHGGRGLTGKVSAGNSLVGTRARDWIGWDGVIALGDGNYLIGSSQWNDKTGAVTLASGGYRLRGTIESWHSVIGEHTYWGDSMTPAYDPVRQRLIVGRAGEDMVSVFTMDQILAGDFEP